MFGSNPAAPDAAQPMIDWINGAPPGELAVELMSMFGQDSTANAPWRSLHSFVEWMFRGYPPRTGIIQRARPVDDSILEAIQLLEHSELIFVRTISDDWPRWSATRLGLATLATGNDAVRQRIKERTGL